MFKYTSKTPKRNELIAKLTNLEKQYNEIESEIKLNKSVMRAIDSNYPQYGELTKQNKSLSRDYISIGKQIDQVKIDIDKTKQLPGGSRKTHKKISRKRARKTNKKKKA